MRERILRRGSGWEDRGSDEVFINVTSGEIEGVLEWSLTPANVSWRFFSFSVSDFVWKWKYITIIILLLLL